MEVAEEIGISQAQVSRLERMHSGLCDNICEVNRKIEISVEICQGSYYYNHRTEEQENSNV